MSTFFYKFVGVVGDTIGKKLKQKRRRIKNRKLRAQRCTLKRILNEN